jgi:hypothetical protein
VLAKVVFVGLADRFFVFTGIFPPDEFEQGELTFNRVVQSLRNQR